MNYIASKVNFKDLGYKGNVQQFEIEGKIYAVNHSNDPLYLDDGVLDISYHKLTLNSESTDYILAFDKKEDVTEPEEWADEYDANNYYVLEIK